MDGQAGRGYCEDEAQESRGPSASGSEEKSDEGRAIGLEGEDVVPVDDGAVGGVLRD